MNDENREHHVGHAQGTCVNAINALDELVDHLKQLGREETARTVSSIGYELSDLNRLLSREMQPKWYPSAPALGASRFRCECQQSDCPFCGKAKQYNRE